MSPSSDQRKDGPRSLMAELRSDIPASIAVALVALPLCLGIAIASGAPPISGLIAGIIGGLIVGALSGSHTSVSGPAAGLTAVVLAALASFGGDFRLFLVALVLTGVIQIGLGVAGAKLIVVKGHTNCGAINAACDQVKLGNVTGLLSKIQAAMEHETETHTNRTSNNSRFVANVTLLNIMHSMRAILDMSPTICEMHQQGTVGLVGAVYDTPPAE